MVEKYRPGAELSSEQKQAILLEILKNEPETFRSVAKLLPDHMTAEQIHEVISQITAALGQIQQEQREFTLPELLPGLMKEVRARREAVKKHGAAAVGFQTRISRLDKLLGGFQTGIHLLAAEPGQGKTTFALQIAATVAKEDFPVLFVSFEEALWKLALKAICAPADLEYKRFQDGKGDIDDLQKAIRDHGGSFKNLTLIEGTSKFFIPDLKARALKGMETANLKKCLIVVDYLQSWAGARRDFYDFRHTVNALVGDLRELSFQIDSPLILISSQNRKGQGEADMTSLKESGDLEYSADSIMFLVEHKVKKGEVSSYLPPARAVDLVIRKNRYGDTGKIELIFKPHIGTFAEVDKQR